MGGYLQEVLAPGPSAHELHKRVLANGTYCIAKNSSAQVQPSDLAFPHQLILYSESAAVNHMSGKLSPEIPTLPFRITLHCRWYRVFLFRARLPIDGSLATRDSADRQRKTVR